MRLPKISFLISILLLSAGFLTCSVATAAGDVDPPTNMDLPSVATQLIVPIGGNVSVKTPGDYINVLFKWGIGLAALLAMGQLVLGGVMYTLSAGGVTNQESAKERMKGSIIGLIVLLGSVTALVTINPRLVNLQPINADRFAEEFKSVEKTGKQWEEARAAASAINTAGLAADERNAYNVKCKYVAKELIKRIDYVVAQSNGINRGIETVKNSVGSGAFGFSYIIIHALSGAPGTGFKSVLKDAQSEKGDDPYMYHCYQDAVISALGYDQRNELQNDFAIFLADFKALPPEFESNSYISGAPIGWQDTSKFDSRSAISREFFENANSTIKDAEKETYNQLTKKDVNKAVDAVKHVYAFEVAGAYLDSTKQMGKTAVNYILYEASILQKNKTITEAQYDDFIAKVKTAIGNDADIIYPPKS